LFDRLDGAACRRDESNMNAVSNLVGSIPATRRNLERLASESNLFAVIDRCDAPEAARLIAQAGQRSCCLFPEEAERKYPDAAPYLIEVSEPLLDPVLSLLASKPQGILAASKTPLIGLRHQFRYFTSATLPDGKTWLFRFYDPRVLRAFIHSCSPDELRCFYGPSAAMALRLTIRASSNS
jgi:Domain of unknown function (DUF4123)